MLADRRLWLMLGGGLGLLLIGAALFLWAAFGPLVFVNALNSAWTCF